MEWQVQNALSDSALQADVEWKQLNRTCKAAVQTRSSVTAQAGGSLGPHMCVLLSSPTPPAKA